MKTLSFDTGAVEYKINEKCTVTFNPADDAFFERIFSAFKAIEKSFNTRMEKAKQYSDPRKLFDIFAELDKDGRAAIDGVFEQPVCDELFGSMSIYALADGLPVSFNLLLAIMDECNSSVATEQKKTNPRLQKYMAKYQRK